MIWAGEVQFCIIMSVRMNHGCKNQSALAKGQVKNKCKSFSSKPHLQQVLVMCLEKRPALAPVGRAFRRKRQAKVCIRGIMFLFFHT